MQRLIPVSSTNDVYFYMTNERLMLKHIAFAIAIREISRRCNSEFKRGLRRVQHCGWPDIAADSGLHGGISRAPGAPLALAHLAKRTRHFLMDVNCLVVALPRVPLLFARFPRVIVLLCCGNIRMHNAQHSRIYNFVKLPAIFVVIYRLACSR